MFVITVVIAACQYFIFCGNQHDITSVVIMRNLFSFRLLTGVKETTFVVSHLTFPYNVSDVVFVLPQALLYSFYCCVLMFHVCENNITSLLPI